MIRVLHLSDVHITSASASVVSDRVSALTAAISPHLPIHAIAFTGDATQSAEEDQFNLFWKRFAEPLLAACKLPPERFVIVPGNHDVDRTRVDRVLEVGLHDALREPDEIDRIWREPDYRSRAVARVQRFVDWCRGKGLQTESTIIRVDDKSVGFACLNSAWLCHRDGERHNIAITRAQAMEAEDLVSEADLKLALSHHPLEWLHDQDKVRIRECLFAKFHAYLQGHMHVGDGTQISTPRGNTIALQAPAIHSAKCFSGFQLYEFDLSSRHITVHSFKILENRLQYVPNQEILPDGKPWTAPLAAAQADSRALLAVQQLNTSLGVRYATSLERLVPIVAHPQKLALSERLLPPHITVVTSKGRSPVKLSRLISDTDSYIVLGDLHSGKTTFLGHLAKKLVDQGVLAVIVLPEQLDTDPGKEGLVQTLSTALGASKSQAKKWADQAIVLLVDEGGRQLTETHWTALAGWRKSWPQLRVVVTCGQSGLTTAGSHGSAFKIAKLEPLPINVIQREVRRLGERLDLPAGLSIEKAIDTLLDAELPRWPWAILMLVDVTARGDVRDVSNLSGLLRRYIDHRLGATASPGEDAKIRGRMLRLLSHEMMTRKTCDLAREDAEGVLEREIRRCALGAEAKSLLEDLLNTRLIVADDDRVRFAFVILQEYFFSAHLAETQWNGVAGLDATSFLRLAGSLSFLSEGAQVPGLAEKAFELARAQLPQGAVALSVDQISALAHLLPGGSPDAAIEKARAAAPGAEELNSSIEESEAAQRGARGARVTQDKARLQSIGLAFEELVGAIAVLRSSAWLDKEVKARLVEDALQIAAVLVGEMSRDPDLLKLFDFDVPDAPREASALLVGIMLLFVGMVVSGQGGAKHLSITLGEVFERETDPIRRIIALMWYFETGLGSRREGDLLAKVNSALQRAQRAAELGMLDVWLRIKFVMSYAYEGSATEIEECLRRVLAERARSAQTREGAAAHTDRTLADLRKEKLVVAARAEPSPGA